MHYWQKLYFICLAVCVGAKHYIPVTLFPEAAALLHGARLFSLSLSSLTPKQLWRGELCQSARALILVFINDCLHLIWVRCTLIMFLPCGRRVLEYDASMQQWNLQLVRCQCIFPIFYQHRLFNKIDFTGRSILWPVIHKYM